MKRNYFINDTWKFGYRFCWYRADLDKRDGMVDIIFYFNIGEGHTNNFVNKISFFLGIDALRFNKSERAYKALGFSIPILPRKII